MIFCKKIFELFAKYAKKHKNRLIFHLNLVLNILKMTNLPRFICTLI